MKTLVFCLIASLLSFSCFAADPVPSPSQEKSYDDYLDSDRVSRDYMAIGAGAALVFGSSLLLSPMSSSYAALWGLSSIAETAGLLVTAVGSIDLVNEQSRAYREYDKDNKSGETVSADLTGPKPVNDIKDEALRFVFIITIDGGNNSRFLAS